MFTFASISYNHSEYIIQHLESIKYQIEEFGLNFDFDYVLCDDNSRDDTVEKARKWLDENRHLFKNITIFKSDINQGTVKNYLKTISMLDTNEAKILAGDDMYSCNNIFETYKGTKIVINFSYPFSLDNSKVATFPFESKYYDKVRVFLSVKNARFLKFFIGGGGSLSGPATYYPTQFLQDESLSNSLSKYKFVEDRPLWRHLFLKRELSDHVVYDFSQLIYYRTSVGVTSVSSPVHTLFKKDCQLLSKEAGIINNFPKYLNPFNYIIRSIIIYSKLMSFVQQITHKGKFYDQANLIESEAFSAKKHIEMLNLKAEIFEKNFKIL
ncbi:glycosyltransferase family A protein [Vibrio splendidus]